MRSRTSRRHPVLALLTGALVVLAANPALADHAGPNGWPNGAQEDARDAPPDDPAFDDVEEGAPFSCLEDGAADQQFEWFGFASVCAPLALYLEGPNTGSPQIAGASVDRAWQVHTGTPEAVVAILDVGAIWDERELDTRMYLNAAELPTAVDADGDGVIEVLDFCTDRAARFECPAAASSVPDANPPDLARGRTTTGNGFLDAQDIILAFSDGVDDDANGYVDDISGWDYFDDDNDPLDASSGAGAGDHGNGRAIEAAGETNNGLAGVGSCPECRIVHLRLWDSFIPDASNYAAATVYATDMGAAVTEVAQAIFADTEFAIDAHAYAWHNGTLPVVVSSDLNSAHHDYPASDPHVLWINGHAPDTRAAEQVPPSTWFRQANLTQFGMHAHVGIGGNTGSQATGKAAGIVALAWSWARQNGITLSPNELKQLVTMTAEDVLPGNTQGVGTPDPSQEGWDQSFGYGRIHARDLLDAITAAAIPPEVEIESPRWFRIFGSDEAVTVTGTVRAARSSGITWVLEVAAGLEPTDADYVEVATGTNQIVDAEIAIIPAGVLADLFGGADLSAPVSTPDEFDVTFRLRAEDADGVEAEDRRTNYVHDDPSLLAGWPLETLSSAIASPRLWDLDADGDLEILIALSDGTVTAYRGDGSVLWRFTTDLRASLTAHASAPGIAALGVPHAIPLTPLIADLDRDLVYEVVVSDSDGNLYRLDAATGALAWRSGTDPANSAVPLRTRNDGRAPGALGAPAIGDLDADGQLEIVQGGLDGFLYAWRADGSDQPGFPFKIATDISSDLTSENDPKIVVSPVVGDLDPDRPGDEIIVPTNEYLPPTGNFLAALGDALQSDIGGIAAAIRGTTSEGLSQALADVDTVTYAFGGDGTLLPGWPLRLSTAAGAALPLIAPSVQPVMGDLDGDGELEVFTSAVTSSTVRVGRDGSIEQTFAASGAGPQSDSAGQTFVPFLEYPSMGDLTGDGIPEALKGAIDGATLVNLAAYGQNLPGTHVFQAWDGATGEYLPAFPRTTADWEILTHASVASVGGGVNQALSPNGLYSLDAFGADGSQPEGWPKFTGGWMVTSPAVGDLDGDGDVEVVGLTREGYIFVWETPGATVENDEWWTFHHDERSSGTYGTDTRPPAPIVDALVTDGVLTFTAPGDDWWVGTATTYEIRTADAPIVTFADWQAATPVAGVPTPGPVRGTESIRLPDAVGAFLAIIAIDEAGNTSPLTGAGGAAPPAPDLPLPTTGGGAALAGLGVLGGWAATRRRRVLGETV